MAPRARFYDRPYLLLVLTCLLWACNAVASRLAVGHISPGVITCGRWAVVLALVALIWRREVERGWALVRPQQWAVLLMGASLTGFNGLYYVAAHDTTAVNISIIQGAVPVFVALGALVLHRTPLRMGQAAGLATALAGVLLVATRGDLSVLASMTFNQGDVLILMAAGLYAGFTLALRGRPGASSIAFFAGLAMGAFVSALPMVGWEAAAGDLHWPTARGWTILVFAAVFPSLMAQMFFMRAVLLIGPGRAGPFINLSPVFGAMAAVLLIREPFAAYHAVALGLVLAGIFLAERSALRGASVGPASAPGPS
jgi:drug/metabolite transporter (DMT)-like permease